MQSLTQSGLAQSAPLAAQPMQAFAGIEAPRLRRRRISPTAGRGLEILGHAIEYLADEFVHEGGFLTCGNGHVEAIQLLMALNRQIYLECPEVPTFGERFQALFHLRAA